MNDVIKEMHDSGKRQDFGTGAVRDSADNKPRIDLFSSYMFKDLMAIDGFDDVALYWFYFKEKGTKNYLYDTFYACCKKEKISIAEGIKRTSYWLYLGALKYKERNWEAGMPVSRVVASADRHLLSWVNGEKDEDHFAAFLCNIMFIYHYKCLISNGYMDTSIDDYPYIDPIEC